jgi:hypothetical protein
MESLVFEWVSVIDMCLGDKEFNNFALIVDYQMPVIERSDAVSLSNCRNVNPKNHPMADFPLVAKPVNTLCDFSRLI